MRGPGPRGAPLAPLVPGSRAAASLGLRLPGEPTAPAPFRAPIARGPSGNFVAVAVYPRRQSVHVDLLPVSVGRVLNDKAADDHEGVVAGLAPLRRHRPLLPLDLRLELSLPCLQLIESSHNGSSGRETPARTWKAEKSPQDAFDWRLGAMCRSITRLRLYSVSFLRP